MSLLRSIVDQSTPRPRLGCAEGQVRRGSRICRTRPGNDTATLINFSVANFLRIKRRWRKRLFPAPSLSLRNAYYLSSADFGRFARILQGAAFAKVHARVLGT